MFRCPVCGADCSTEKNLLSHIRTAAQRPDMWGRLTKPHADIVEILDLARKVGE